MELARLVHKGEKTLDDCVSREVENMKVKLVVNGEELSTNEFVSSMLASTLKGMVEPLRKPEGEVGRIVLEVEY